MMFFRLPGKHTKSLPSLKMKLESPPRQPIKEQRFYGRVRLERLKVILNSQKDHDESSQIFARCSFFNSRSFFARANESGANRRGRSRPSAGSNHHVAQ